MNREQIAAVVREASRVPRARYETDGGFTLDRMIDAMAEIVAEKLTPAAASASAWELVHDVAFERVRRMHIPGGWLYQTEIELMRESPIDGVRSLYLIGWHPPIFVPDIHLAGGSP